MCEPKWFLNSNSEQTAARFNAPVARNVCFFGQQTENIFGSEMSKWYQKEMPEYLLLFGPGNTGYDTTLVPHLCTLAILC